MQKLAARLNMMIDGNQMRKWHSALVMLGLTLLLACPADAHGAAREEVHSVKLKGGGKLLVYAQAGKTYAELAGRPATRVVLSRGQYACNAPCEDFEVIGQTSSGVAILRVVYHTGNANPDGFCGAGQEEILQVVATKPSCKQTFSVETASCVASRESDDGSITWDPKKSTLSLSWTEPTKDDMFEEKSEYHINPDGSVKKIASKRTKI